MASLAWGGFSNGKIPLSALTRVSNFAPLPGEPVGAGGALLMTEAAHQWEIMCQDAKAATGQSPTASECYRDYPSQQGRYTTYQQNKKPLAAYPGTSNHGWGRSVDIGTSARTWITNNGRKYGFDATVAGEPWHFDYLGNPTITKAVSAKAENNEPEEEFMSSRIYRNNKTGEMRTIDVTTGYDVYLAPGYPDIDARLGIAHSTVIDVPPNEMQYLQSMALTQRQRLAADVWNATITGYNGAQTAGARLAGIDEKSNTLSADTTKALTAAIVAALPKSSGGTALPVDVDKLAAAVAPLVSKAVADTIAARMVN